MTSEADDIRIRKLEEALDIDGYRIVEYISKFGRLGVVAEHKTAFNYDTGEKKRVYYVEGTHYEMGYLLGFLAEEQIREMTGDFTDQTGFINKTWVEKNCPSTYYFAPQREDHDDLIIVTNHFIIPEMQLYSMHPWTSRVLGMKINDIQWRYDALNNEIMQALR
ncbi:MAG: hypothetical protein ACOX4T_02205 [Acetivibrionales bacterium]